MKQYAYNEFTSLPMEYSMHMSLSNYSIYYYIHKTTGVMQVTKTPRNSRTGKFGEATTTFALNGLEFDSVADVYMGYMEMACGGVYD